MSNNKSRGYQNTPTGSSKAEPTQVRDDTRDDEEVGRTRGCIGTRPSSAEVTNPTHKTLSEEIADEIDFVTPAEARATLDALSELVTGTEYPYARDVEDGNTPRQTGRILGTLERRADAPFEVQKWANSNATRWEITRKAVTDGGDELVFVTPNKNREAFHTNRCSSVRRARRVFEGPLSTLNVDHCKRCQEIDEHGRECPAVSDTDPTRGVASVLSDMDVDEFDRHVRGVSDD